MTGEKRIQTLYDEITSRIIGCAMGVHRKLGPGYREDTYQRDLEEHFSQAKLSYEPQKVDEVYDSQRRDCLIGYYIPDFVVEEKIIVGYSFPIG